MPLEIGDTVQATNKGKFMSGIVRRIDLELSDSILVEFPSSHKKEQPCSFFYEIDLKSCKFILCEKLYFGDPVYYSFLNPNSFYGFS